MEDPRIVDRGKSEITGFRCQNDPVKGKAELYRAVHNGLTDLLCRRLIIIEGHLSAIADAVAKSLLICYDFVQRDLLSRLAVKII